MELTPRFLYHILRDVSFKANVDNFYHVSSHLTRFSVTEFHVTRGAAEKFHYKRLPQERRVSIQPLGAILDRILTLSQIFGRVFFNRNKKRYYIPHQQASYPNSITQSGIPFRVNMNVHKERSLRSDRPTVTSNPKLRNINNNFQFAGELMWCTCTPQRSSHPIRRSRTSSSHRDVLLFHLAV